MLVSGKSYNLESIFSRDKIIMIPDMQREYCWATTVSEVNNENLVHNFTLDLIANSENSETVQMGLLYAYESPRNQIQLCDGQQRVTTLFLLLGFLHKKSKNIQLKEEIEKVLILPDSYSGIIECRLRYAIRESTLFFTRDLTENIFLTSWGNIKNIKDFIKNQDWYFNEYDLDPSIQNMLEALRVFQEFDNDLNDNVALHILKDINFLYFDMENRTYGEEQFVVLNTTGKPLTNTENIKPKILGELNAIKVFKEGKSALQYFSDIWEEWEYYFWINRNEHHFTSDKGLNEFFRWIYIIEKVKLEEKLGSDSETYTASQKALVENTYDVLDLRVDKVMLIELINDYFCALKELVNDDEVRKRFLFQPKRLSQIQIFEFLPLLTYLKNFKSGNNNLGYIRLKNFLRARAKDSNVSKASSTTAIRSIKIVLELTSKGITDIAEYSAYSEQASDTILSSLEKFKFDVFQSSTYREEVEKAFWEAESLKTCDGNIEFIFDAIDPLLKRNHQDFNLKDFNRMKKIVELTFNRPNNLMRRTLLSFDHYYKWHGSTPTLSSARYTLGGDAFFFGNLANEKSNYQSDALLNFLREIFRSPQLVTKEFLEEYMNNRVENFIPLDSNIWERTRSALIKNGSNLEKMQNKLFCVSEKENRAYLLKKQKVSTNDAFEQLKFEDEELITSN